MNAAITFTDAPRPEAATQVRLEAFEGPLGLLLALIEQRQLDILRAPTLRPWPAWKATACRTSAPSWRWPPSSS
jgi:hypothetical protein